MMINEDAHAPTAEIAAPKKASRGGIVNPYASSSKKKTAAPKPHVVQTSILSTWNSQESGAAATNAASVASMPMSEKEQEEDNVAKVAALPKAASSTQSTGNLPPWKRLPSQTVSFGSAEILTVSELRTHYKVYADRSVRITGAVWNQLVLDENVMALVVGDVVEQAKQQRNALRNPYNSQTKTPATTPLFKTPGKPLFSKTPAKTPLSKKRKTVFVGKTPTNSLLNKNRSHPVTPRTPILSIDKAVSSLRDKESVLVLANPTHVHTAIRISDLAMVMGEVQTYDPRNPPAAVAKVFLDKLLSQSKDQLVYYVVPRIIRNVNGTDMTVHDKALRFRRESILQNTRHHTLGESSLLQGCGPPPYPIDENEQNRVEISSKLG